MWKVSVCAGADVMAMWAGFLSGAFAAIVYMCLHHLMLKIKIDDPLDAVAVHFGGGFWGLISASMFGNGGIVFGASHESALRLWFRLIGAGIMILWGAAWSCIIFGTLKFFGKLRVTEEQEIAGLDISMHNEPGYPLKGWFVHPVTGDNTKSLVKPEIDSYLKSEKVKPQVEMLITSKNDTCTFKPETEALLKPDNRIENEVKR